MPDERIFSAKRNIHLRITLPSLITVALFVAALFVVLFPAMESGYLERKKETARHLVHTVQSMLAGYDQMVRSGVMDLDEAKQLACQVLRDMRYGKEGKDYFWVHDVDSCMVMHPYRPELEGQDLRNFRDPNGVALFSRMTELAGEQGGGLVEYLWQWQDDPDLLAPKLSYVSLFEPWGWVIGTGLYVKDVHEEIASYRHTLLLIAAAILCLVLLLTGYMVREAVRAETVRAELNAALEEERERYRKLFENSIEGIFQSTPDGKYMDANPALAKLYGYETPEQLRTELVDIRSQLYLDPTRRDELVNLLDIQGEVSNFQSQAVRRDGEVIWISESARAVRNDKGDLLYFEGMVEDITERKRHAHDMAEQKAFFQELFESSPLAISMLDADGLILDVNPSFEKMFGHDAEEIAGRMNREVVVPEKYFGEAEAFRRTILKGHSMTKETERQTADGKLLPVELVGSPIRLGERVVGAYYIYRDITERKEFERQLSHQAFHDALTALPNRTLYMERLRHALERSRRREDYNFAVLMVDLDRFKRINDTLGHHVGDQLLIGFALRILSCIRTVDTVARLGGDEFALLLEEFEIPREVIRVSNRIRDVLGEPFTIEGHQVHTGASMGIVLDTRGYATAEDILRDADIAMYQAKEQGKSRLVFNKRMHQQAAEVGRMEAELRVALDKKQFVLHYQPIVSLADRAVQGFEALVRWNHPRRGLVMPLDFIPLAEETGLIVPMGQWILHEACRQMKEWITNGVAGQDMSMSVNLSARQFLQTDLVEFVQATLDATGLSASCLKLEVTESVIMQDAAATSAKLGRLKEHGVKIMIDDFGTGYSSLSYLQQFPVDYLKIDRSFISGGGDEVEKMEIVKTIISLARNLGLGVVAEGVEKEEQFVRLQQAKCETAQGFMFSRPMDAEAATCLLEAAQAKSGEEE